MGSPLENLLDLARGSLESSARQEKAALAFLAGDGCPACALAAESEQRWVKYFIAAGNREPEPFQALRAALGPCGRHLRKLLAARNGSDVFAAVAPFIAREARKRAGTSWGPELCPGCEREAWAERHAIDVLLRTMHRPAVGERLDAVRGFCLPHLLQALERDLAPAAAIRLAGLGCSALGRPAGPELLARLCGRDDDGAARAELLRASVLPARGASLHAWTRAVLEADDCPSCLAERSAVRGALGWVAAGDKHESWELRFCPRHLATLAALDPPSADRVAVTMAGEWSSALARHVEALTGLRGFVAGRLRRGQRREALDKLLGGRACRACDVQRTAAERAGALVEAALHDRTLVEAYSRSHGLCFRHLASQTSAARHGAALERLQARLVLVGWELDEAQRKRSWSARWEPAGAEAGAWRQLPTILGEPGPGSRDSGWARPVRER
jgi:hypothetical protein